MMRPLLCIHLLFLSRYEHAFIPVFGSSPLISVQGVFGIATRGDDLDSRFQIAKHSAVA